MLKEKIINEIIETEGGYVNDPSDSGGETNFGITKEVARAFGYLLDMKGMSVEVAFSIYSERYWDSVRADQIALRSELIAEEVVDTAVNMGINRAGVFLQKALNSLNDGGKIYNDVTVDGSIGAMTIHALTQYLSRRDELTLCKALNCLQGVFYIELAAKRPKDERFVYGWLKNRVAL